MEIKIYDSSMRFQGIVENQTSLQWNRKYNDVGSFELHVPITEQNTKYLQLGNLVWIRDAAEVGVIESIKLDVQAFKNSITVTGRFAESYMDRRLIRPRITFSGTVEDAMRKILSDAVAIPNVVLDQRHGYTETVTFQATYKELLAYEKKLAQSVNYGFRFRPDFSSRELVFEIYKGEDKSKGQHDNPHVIFSDQYCNLENITHSQNNQVLKNVAYVGGQGEGLDRTFITVGDDSLTGLERREMFVDAKDVQKEDGMSDADYIQLLTTRGNEKLTSNSVAESIEIDVNPLGNFKYGIDYDLGDIVTINKASWGIETKMRITEVSEIYEGASAKIVPTFGTPLATTISFDD